MGVEDSNRKIERFPEERVIMKDLRSAIDGAVGFLFSHEPVVEEVHRAFVELGERIREAEEVWETLKSAEKVGDGIEEEITYLVIGARKTLQALIEALKRAEEEVKK